MNRLTLIALLALSACSAEKQQALPAQATSGESVYFGGDIITMEGDAPQYVEAVLVKDGIIAFAGSKADALKQSAGMPEQIDLKGATLMPGFIEPHVHPSLAAIMLPNEIIAPYDWVLPDGVRKGVSGHDAYMARLSEAIASRARPGELFFVWGYHQLWHGELSRELLNRIAPDQPVGVIHRSFHEIFLNDKAIELLGIKQAEFAGNPQVAWDKGHFYEGGWLALVPRMSKQLINPERYLQGLGIMTQLIRQNGITTIAEPGFPSSDFNMEYALLKKEMDKNPPYRAYLIPNGTQLRGMKGGDAEAMAFMATLPQQYNTSNITFLPRQVKLFADGAIYSQLMQLKDGYTDGHQGQWMTPPDLLNTQIRQYWDAGYRIHMHANGDAGIQQALDDLAEANKANPRSDHRFTLHHMGYFSDAQAQQIAELGVEASVNPYYLWALADKYSEFGLGKERAENLVRIKSLTDRNVPVSFHSDFSMAPMEPLTLAWTAINRVTSQNNALSQEQRIPVFAGMQAITLTAAGTLGLEGEIGSIKAGKKADFVVLDRNPFKVEPMAIKDIKVIDVVFDGKHKPVAELSP
jgi:predicted amidohydrolase YtcJ